MARLTAAASICRSASACIISSSNPKVEIATPREVSSLALTEPTRPARAPTRTSGPAPPATSSPRPERSRRAEQRASEQTSLRGKRSHIGDQAIDLRVAELLEPRHLPRIAVLDPVVDIRVVLL